MALAGGIERHHVRANVASAAFSTFWVADSQVLVRMSSTFHSSYYAEYRKHGGDWKACKFFIFLQESTMLYNALRIVSDSLAGRGQALMT
jgi:hypothetical protein